MTPIKIVACYQGSQKEFFSQKSYSSLLQIRLFFRKLKDIFLLKAFLQYTKQECDENILNSQM